MSEPQQSAYALAGVDIEAGDRAVELMKGHIARTRRPEVIGGIGGFAGLFDVSENVSTFVPRPLLAPMLAAAASLEVTAVATSNRRLLEHSTRA